MVQLGTLDFENPHCNPPPVVIPAADNDVVELFIKSVFRLVTLCCHLLLLETGISVQQSFS